MPDLLRCSKVVPLTPAGDGVKSVQVCSVLRGHPMRDCQPGILINYYYMFCKSICVGRNPCTPLKYLLELPVTLTDLV